MKQFYKSNLLILSILVMAGMTGRVWGQTTTFTYTGAVQAWTAPAGVTIIGIDAKGGCGGYAYISSGTNPVALGGRVQCTMNVTPGSVYYVYVGGAGNNWSSAIVGTGGFNGGGGGGSFAACGGGATDFRTSASGTGYTGRLVVAGAGGGGGDFSYAGGAGGGVTGGTGTLGACGGGQTGPGCSTGHGLGVVGAGANAGVYSIGGGGGGWWGGNSGVYYDGGGGGGSNYPATADGVIVTAVVHTQGYSGANGNGQLVITVLCSNPGSIVGSVPVCPGSTITLTNPTAAGGTWVSSNPSVATINGATGVVTGVTTGTAVITYSETNPCGGPSALATTVVTVNPLPGPITGTMSACTTFSTTLSDGGTGSWTSSNPSVAAVSSSGSVIGVSAGTATISYTLSTGCAPATAVVTINSFPAAIGGTAVVCAAGGTSTLTDALSGGTWNSGATSIATIGVGTGIVTGVSAGTAPITYTAPTGCTISTTVTVNPLPTPVLGLGSVCVGSTIILSDATAGGTWSSSNTAIAGVGAGTGVVNGVVPGSVNVTYSLASTGCRVSAPIVVNSLPAAISGPGAVCAGGTATLTDAGGGSWTSSNLSAATVNAFTGVVSGIAPGTTTISYTLLTGCSTSYSMLVNPLPVAYAVSGGGGYCAGGAGVHVGLTYAGSGVNYVLYRGSAAVSGPVPGANSGLDFGLETGAGTYTVTALNTVTGCTGNMSGSVTITVNPVPALHNVTGGGSYCGGSAGSSVGLDGSDVGVHYQLYDGSTAVGAVLSGTGSALGFGSYTGAGSYTVLATIPATGCSQVMSSSATIDLAAPPTAYLVTGGGSFCAGGGGVHVYLGGGSDAGTTYQLYEGTTAIGGPVYSFTGGPIDFGPQMTGGIYTVIGINGSGCSGGMSGSVTVVVNPLPAVNIVTGGGGYCAGSSGVHIGLSYSSPGINYQLIFGGGSVITVPGSGSGLDFGSYTAPGVYTAIAMNSSTLCSSTMSGSATVTENPVPDGFNVMGGGSYCAGGAGENIATDASESGINYQLYNGTSLVGAAIGGSIAGTGINFGDQTAAGIYTVRAVNAITGCMTNGTGSAAVTVQPLPTLHTITGGGNYCFSGAGVHVGLSGSNSGKLYELMMGGSIVSTLSGTGSALDFGYQTVPGSYSILAIDGVTGCQVNMLGVGIVGIDSLPASYTVSGGGSYCAGGTGFSIGITGSASGVRYQLVNGSTSVGAAISGSGSAISFGPQTAAGIYTVVGTNALTGCSSGMSGRAFINVMALPAPESVTGGGRYCAGGGGSDIKLGGSVMGVSYQLYAGSTAIGAPMTGTGDSLDFGLNPSGTYSVRATDTTTGCNALMTGTAMVSVVTPLTYTVTGGGSYCAGGTGVSVGQSGSSAGVSYTLYLSGSAVGSAIPGTGSALSFGSITGAGTYWIEAMDTMLGCTVTMPDSVTIVVNSLPVAEAVTGGGSFCAGTTGAHVGLSSSVSGVSYQLYDGVTAVGSPVLGTTGTALDFGAETIGGTYTVRAVTTLTGCANNMTGSATVTVLPTPTAYSVTVDNSGNYCASDSGVHVHLSNSQAGDSYQLFRSGSIAGASIMGTGAALDMGLQSIGGSYTVTAINLTTSCVANMLGSGVVNIVPLPAVHSITGGGGICPGSIGAVIGQDGSDIGNFYELYRNGVSLVSTVYGTGTAITFGDQATPGTYTVMGNSQITTCQNNMLGSASIFLDTVTQPIVTLRAFPGTGIGVSHIDSIRAQVTGATGALTFQWYVNGHAIAGATNALFTDNQLFTNDSVSCMVTNTGVCGGKSGSGSVTITLHDVSVTQLSAGVANVSLVPNPNRGLFTIKGSVGTGDEEVVAEVTNMLGQVVFRTTLHTQGGLINSQVDLGSSLSAGIYHLSLAAAGGNAVLRFVIE